MHVDVYKEQNMFLGSIGSINRPKTHSGLGPFALLRGFVFWPLVADT